MADCTVIIPTYKRPENIPLVVESIRAQTVKCEIHIWDNAATTDKALREDCGADLLMCCPRNWGSWVRFPAMAFVRTPYAWQMDDDLHFYRPDVLERYIAESKKLGDKFVIGAGGRKLGVGIKAYQAGTPAAPGPAVMVNTGFTLFPMCLVSQIPMNPLYCAKPIDDKTLLNCDDPWVCAFLPTAVTTIPIDGRTWYGIDRLDERGLGVSHMPGAMDRRNDACNKYLREKENRMNGGAIQ